MKHALKVLSASCALLIVAAASATEPAGKSDAVVSIVNPAGMAESNYWTPERFKAAKPLPLPMARQSMPPADSTTTQPAEEPQGSDGRAPSSAFRTTGQQLFVPDAGSVPSLDLVEPRANGTFGAPYTSSRVFPLFDGSGAPFSADRAYPYRTTGILFFSINGAPYLCSASVIKPRVVLTAGHCLHSGDGTRSGWYSNWVFVPAYRNGAAPYNSWSHWTMGATTLTWFNGGGGVPNAADYAMLVFADQPMTSGGSPVKLGYVTGWLGWQTLSLNGNHTTKLGYPCNLDRCGIMQDVTSQSFRTTDPNNVEYGSDARGGSSGGPWIQNFQTLSAGGGTGSNTGSNRVVGVTSYGYISEDPKVQGASIPDIRFIRLLNVVCSTASNCN